MKDKRMSNKQTMSNKGKNNNKSNWSNKNNKKSNWSNKGNKKFNRFIPTQEQRVDQELLQEVSVFLSLSKDIPDETICRHYGITKRQLEYIKKHKQNWDNWEILEEKELK